MPGFDAALDSAIADSWALMAQVGAATRGTLGITRPPYDAAEQRAAEATRAALLAEGIAAEYDAFGNLHATLGPAGNPAIGIGSHFDSVPDGGNYDGLAGVMAALAILRAAKRTETKLARPLRLLGLRGEESPWYGTAYLGSRMALGHVPFATMGALIRGDTGRTLADHMAALGFPGQPGPSLTRADLACWLELHIEQGPLLIGRDLPIGIGIATAIRGNIRHAGAKCFGAWAHSAAVPRAFRSDAVTAVAELVMALDSYWTERLAQHDDNFVCTIGILATRADQHAMTKVPGEVAFTLNLGATDPDILRQSGAFARAQADAIAASRRVRFDLGPDTGSQPTPLDPALIDRLDAAAASLGLGRHRMPTVGHDAGMFAQAGIPAAMVLVRNRNGSHNPDEALEESDYAAGVRVLARAAMDLAK